MFCVRSGEDLRTCVVFVYGPKKDLSLGEVYGYILDASSSYWAAYLVFIIYNYPSLS